MFERALLPVLPSLARPDKALGARGLDYPRFTDSQEGGDCPGHLKSEGRRGCLKKSGVTKAASRLLSQRKGGKKGNHLSGEHIQQWDQSVRRGSKSTWAPHHLKWWLLLLWGPETVLQENQAPLVFLGELSSQWPVAPVSEGSPLEDGKQPTEEGGPRDWHDLRDPEPRQERDAENGNRSLFKEKRQRLTGPRENGCPSDLCLSQV